MKAKRAAHKKTPEQIEATRNGLLEILDWCREGWINGPLPQPARLTLWRIMDALVHGYDPRVTLGIPVKDGRPREGEGWKAWMGVHYWFLRKTEKDAVALQLVADAWGVSVPQVRKIKGSFREASLQRLSTGEFRADNLESMAQVYREQQQLRK